jgi:hypothetical protein
MSKFSRRDAIGAIAAVSLAANVSASNAADRSKRKFPPGAILRMSRGRFDPKRFAEVSAMINRTGDYLIPAIKKLPGLLAYYAATTPDGITTQVSIWESAEAGMQMAQLPEMRDRARSEAVALGVEFEPIVQFPMNWTI